MIEFDEKLHKFFDPELGIEIPNVTRILSQEGFVTYHNKSPILMERGKMLHKLTEQYDRGESFECERHLIPYIQVYEKFLKKEKVKVLEVEKLVYNQTYLYAGILDRVIIWNDKVYVVDYKFGQPADWHELQLNAYRLAYAKLEDVGMMNIYFDEGNYKIHPVKDDNSFLAIASVYHLKCKMKKYPNLLDWNDVYL